MIYLRFSTTRTLIPSAIIRWRTQCAISHVEYWDSESGFTLGSRWSRRHFENGVQWRSRRYCEEQTNVILARFAGIELAYRAGQKFLGYGYNLKAIFAMVLANDWESKGKMFCSEFIVRSAEEAGIKLVNDRVIAERKITPRDILLSTSVEVVNGKIDSSSKK